MKRIAEPTLPDELLLLALDDGQGSVIPAAAPALDGALVGAIMMELALQGRIHEGTDRRLVADPTPTDDEVLDDVRLRVSEANHLHTAATWVTRLSADLPRLKDRLVRRLTASGVLEQRDGRVWWVFPKRTYPLADDVVERQTRDRIRAVILDGETCNARTAALLSLVQACNLLDEVFTAEERPRARRRLVELLTGGPGEDATMDRRRQTTALSGLSGATRRYTSDRYRESSVVRDTFWDVYTYQSLTSAWPESSSGDAWPASTWDDRTSAPTASAAGASEGGSASTPWSSGPWADDSGTAGNGSSASESSSGGWVSWWSSGSDSSGDSSGGSWWGGGSPDNSSSDSGGWDSGGSDSGSSSDSGSGGC